MSLFSRPQEVKVVADGESLIWAVPVDGITSKEVMLTVGDGCQAILLRDGAKTVFTSGVHKIDWRRSVSGHTVSLYGVSVGQRFTLKFGAGDIPYNDWETGETPMVGLNGECEVEVSSGDSIKGVFGPGFRSIKIGDIKEKIISKTKEIVKGELANTIKNYSYSDVNGMIGKLSDKLKEKFSKEFTSDGIMIQRCSIREIHFPEGYAEHRQEVKAERAGARKKDEQHKKDMDVLSRFYDGNGEAGSSTGKEAGKPVYCPRCGQENPAGTKFCKNCGIKIN